MKYFAFVLTAVILTACSRQEHSESTDTENIRDAVTSERAVAAVSASATALPQIVSAPPPAASAVQPALEIQNAQALTLSALPVPGALAISADGKTGAYIDDHNEVIVWDALQLTPQENIKLPEMKPTAVAVSPNGDHLAIGYSGSSIVIWSRSNNKVLMTLSGYNGSATALAFSPDGKILASGTSDYITRLWDLRSGKRLREFIARDGDMVGSDSGKVVSLQFSGDGGLLLAQEFYRGQYEVGRGLTIWDAQAGFEVSTKHVAPPNSDNNERSGMSVGGMGWMLAYTGHDGLIAERLDDCGSTSHRFGTEGYSDTIVTDVLGRWVAAIEGYSLNFLDISGKAEAQKITLPGKAIGMVAHPDGSSILVLLNKQDSAGNISDSGGMIYRIAVPEQMQALPPMTIIANKVKCEPSKVARTEMDFRAPGKMPMLHEIARFSVLDIQNSQSDSDTTVNKSDQPIYANGLLLTRDGLLKALYERRGRPYEGAGAAVWSVDSHKLIQFRDTRKLAYLSPLHENWLARDREGNVLDILGGHVVTNVKEGSGENYSFSTLGADPDTGDVYRLAGKSIEHYAANGKRLEDIPGTSKKVLSLSARNGRLAILYTDYTGEILQASPGDKKKTFGPLNKEGNCDIGGIRLSSDGRYVQAGFDCGDGGDMFWLLDTLTGKWTPSRFFIAPLPTHAARAVVRGERRYQLAVMDLEKSVIFARLPPHLGNDKDVHYWQLSSAISDDGRLVASGANDGTIHVWDIDTGKMSGMARTGSNVNRMVFDPTGRKLAAALDNGNILVFEIEN